MNHSQRLFRSVLLTLSALGLAAAALAADPSGWRPARLTPPDTCTAWLFDGCCIVQGIQEERQSRTCTTSTGLSFTETRCVATECV